MFAKDKLVMAEGSFVQCRPTANFPIYRCRCLNCPFYAENITDSKLAEQTAKNHAEQFRHRVRLSFDLRDVEITTYSGEERVD